MTIDVPTPSTAKTPARRARLIDLRDAKLDLPTPMHVRDAAQRALAEGATHYTTRPGLNPLRSAIASKLERENGLRVHPEREVLVTCGAREALFVALHVLLGRGDEFLVPAPAPSFYREIARMAGAATRTVGAVPAGGFAVDPEAVEARVTRRSRALLIASPSSPAGSVLDEERLAALAELATRHGLAVVSVETLEPFVFEHAMHRSIGSLPGMAERTVTINGFDAYGLSGWRVGYLVGPASLLGPMTQLKQAMSICSPAVSQYAALAAITGPREPLEAARAVVAERRDRAFAALQAASVPFIRPAAGYHALIDSRPAGAASTVIEQRLRSAGLRLRPGGAFGAPGWFSMALTRPPEVLALAAERLGAALAGLKGGLDGG